MNNLNNGESLTLRKLIDMAKSINIDENILDIPLDVRVSEKELMGLKSANCEGMHVRKDGAIKLIIDFIQR